MSEAELEFWFLKGCYTVIGGIILWLFFYFIRGWRVSTQKGRLYDLEIKKTQSRDILKNMSNDDLIKQANDAMGTKPDGDGNK